MKRTKKKRPVLYCTKPLEYGVGPRPSVSFQGHSLRMLARYCLGKKLAIRATLDAIEKEIIDSLLKVVNIRVASRTPKRKVNRKTAGRRRKRLDKWPTRMANVNDWHSLIIGPGWSWVAAVTGDGKVIESKDGFTWDTQAPKAKTTRRRKCSP